MPWRRIPHTSYACFADFDVVDGTFPGLATVREDEISVATRKFAKGTLVGAGGFGKASAVLLGGRPVQ